MLFRSDEYVDMEFGTGALKVTPAHDINDYELGIKHGLKTINILNDNGTLSENAELYVGQDRFEVRKEIEKELDEKGYLVRVEDIINKVGFSERTDAVIEPKLSLQWFCNMEKLAKPALDNVMNDNVKFHPAKFKNTYRHWMENVKDWCVSRQLWWGQRIPAWYCQTEGCHDVVVVQKQKPGKCSKCQILNTFKQDEDVLDTWFSSWLWPISVFDGFKNPNNADINYYYPTNDLVTAPEILFFWVARMIMAGYEYKGDLPFKNVYLTGIVRDKLGRKMSKSLGNSPDPIDLIGKYGADGVRVGMLLCSPAGNDLPFDEQLCEQGRNFSNKIWNAFRLIQSWEVHEKLEQPSSSLVAIEWFRAKLNATLEAIEKSYDQYRISEVLMSCYKLIWDDFCSWYLEMIKPAYQSPIDKATLDQTVLFFEDLLKIIHPFMPFISEELYHLLNDREEKDCVMLSNWPTKEPYAKQLITDFEVAAQVITEVRSLKKDKNIPMRDAIQLSVKENHSVNKNFDTILIKLCNLSELIYVQDQVENAFSFMVGTNEYFVPINSDSIDLDAEKDKLNKEIDRLTGFLVGVNKKLSNERFVNNAPEQVVAVEKKKQADAESKIKALKDQLEVLG